MTQHPSFSWNSPWTPDLKATLMFIIQEEKVLLIRKKRGIGAGKINGPGGKFEPGETAEECVIREVQEELGITVLDPKELGHLSFIFLDKSIPNIEGHVFVGTQFTGTPIETDEALPQWTPMAEIPFDEMWEDDKYWLPQLLKGEKIKAQFLFEGEKMIDKRITFLD